MKKATPEDLDLLVDSFPKFVTETRKNFGSVNDSFNTFENKLDDIYKLLSTNATEAHILAQSVDKAANKIGQHTKEIINVAEDLQTEIASNTKIVIKEVDKPVKKWYQFWVKNKT